jgi:hypothetical protein
MKQMIIEWKNVEEDGLPEPNGNKIYFVVYPSGDTTGIYDYSKTYNYRTFEAIKISEPKWRLDFDGGGHEDEITDYFEIVYPWE